jgi:lysyl-tRNA synthetase class 2
VTAPRRGVAAPSDVVQRGARRQRCIVGGRVVSATVRALVLADALSTLRVALAADVATVEAGDLVVVEGTWSGSRLVRARVVEQNRGEPPTGASEFGRLALDGVGPRLVARGEALGFVRRYFEKQGFVEVETPTRVTSPGLDANVDALRAEGGFLITSPELHMKRLLVGGMPRVYQLARVSRAGEHGVLHEPEFTMLEWYRAFSGMEAVLHDTEALVSGVVSALSPARKRRKSRRVFVQSPDGRKIDVTPPFPRLTVRKAFREHAAVADAALLAHESPDDYFQLFVDRVEPALAAAPTALVLTEFPMKEAALARPCPHDATVAERFEVYVGGVELCNGFGELTDPAEQRRRFELECERRRSTGGREQPIDERFLTALEEGMPPSGGNALGFDRLVALATGTAGIAGVIAFPRDRL